MRLCQVRIDGDGLVRAGQRLLEAVTLPVQHASRHVGLGQQGVERQGPVDVGLGQREGLGCRDLSPVLRLAQREHGRCLGCPGRCEIRVDVGRLAKEIQGLPGITLLEFAREMPALEIQVVRRHAGLAGRRGGRAWVEVHAEGGDDGRRYLVLDPEDIGQLAVEGIRPEVIAVGGVDQLCGDADPVAGLADTSLQQRTHVQRVADGPDVLFFAAKRE